MKISSVYTQKEKLRRFNYRFEFKNVTHKGNPSLMLYHDSYKIVSSTLSHLYEYSSLHRVKPYENIKN